MFHCPLFELMARDGMQRHLIVIVDNYLMLSRSFAVIVQFKGADAVVGEV